MQIDPKVEEAARDLLGYAIRGEFEQFADAIETVGEQRFLEADSLCLRVAGYVAVDASGHEWPADAQLRHLARQLAGLEDKGYQLSESDAYGYLARVVLGFEPLLNVFPDQAKAAVIPFFATAALLVARRPEGKHWWEYLDMIEQALEAAAPLPETIVPAVLLLSRRSRALKGQAQA